MKNYLVLGLVVALAFGATAVSAQKSASSGEALRSQGSSSDSGVADGTPDAMLSVDYSGVNSWDAQADPDNEIVSSVLGAGAIVTGVGWNMSITTVGASWLSEVVLNLSGDGGDVFLTVGVGDDMPGSASYASGGIVDFTDNGLGNSPAFPDGSYPVEVFESFDDVADAIDATYDPGSSLDVAYIAGAPVPTMPEFGLLALLVVLLAAGTLLLRRRASQS